MIYNRNQKLYKLNPKNTYVLADFDGTITQDGITTWASIFKNNLVSKEFINECTFIYKKYHIYEIDENIPFIEKIKHMDDWYYKNIETLTKYKITKEIIDSSARGDNMHLRDGAKEFLEKLYKLQIPVIIISGGVGNIIEKFLRDNNCYYSNIYICANFLLYEDDIVSNFRDNYVIHPLSKSEKYIQGDINKLIQNRHYQLLLGNSIDDIKMSSRSDVEVLKIGFLDENINERLDNWKDNFDIVCTNNSTYDSLMDIISFKESDDEKRYENSND